MSREEFITGDLVSGTSLREVSQLRSSASHKTTVPKARVTFAQGEGYRVDAERRRLVRMAEPKENWKRFEDAVRLLLAKSGFSEMNGGERCYVNVGTTKNPVFSVAGKSSTFLKRFYLQHKLIVINRPSLCET